MLGIIKFLHLLSLVVWIGMIVFFSFFAAPSIFKKLSREIAGEVVKDIFPKYWLVGYVCGIVSVSTLFVISYMNGESFSARLLILIVMTILSFYSGLIVGRSAVRVKLEIKAASDVSEKERLRAIFKKIHAKSSILNMTTLFLGIVVIFLTAARL